MRRSLLAALTTTAVAGLLLLSVPSKATGSNNEEATRTTTSSTTSPSINWLDITRANRAPVDSNVYVRCTIVSVAEPRPDSRQPYSVYLMDGTGTTRAVIFQDTWRQIPNTDFIRPGIKVDIFGQAGEYRGQRQLTIAQPNHIRMTPGSSETVMMTSSGSSQEYTAMSVGAISLLSVGQRVAISGTVSKFDTPTTDRSPYRIEVRDPTGSIDVVYWDQHEREVSPENRPVIGRDIHIGGVVSEFRGDLQIRIDEPQMISRRPFAPQTASNEEEVSEEEGKPESR
ncbi:MAG: hypothetical protein JJU11_09355 [Candidatus Sumerlaeia bacterium]|nr:hypothetical protein [Candidatus Sumerlaeia bacterium]